MRLRVRRTMRTVGIQDDDLVLDALDRAMAPRLERLNDDHDPRFLHPGRTVLVAMEDGGLRDPGDLAVAAVLESFSPELRGSPGAPRGGVDPAPSGSRDGASSPAERPEGPLDWVFDEGRGLGSWTDPDRAERILSVREELQVVALAEWLDQLRHLRHWADHEVQELAGRVTRNLYLPLAQRVSEALARRLDWWHRRVHLASFGGSVDH